MQKLSIIVPVYNVENYLPRCIDSILKQTYTDFELILIDDGSTDRCGKICDEYSESDRRIIVRHQLNSGVSVARNVGLSIATGTYIGFVDSDDWIEPDMYQIIIEKMERERTGLGLCSWNNVYEDGRVKQHYIEIPTELTRDEFLMQVFSISRTVSGAVWNKVFLKEKVKSLFDETVKVGEDWLFLCNYCKQISSVSFSNRYLYNVYERNDSVMRGEQRNEFLGVSVSRQLIGEMAGLNKVIKQAAEAKYLDTSLRVSYMNLPTDSESTKKELKSYIRKNWIGIMLNELIPWKSRINYIRIGV